MNSADTDNAQPELSQTVQVVRDVWSGLLGTDDIAPEDNFFQIGGHSLLAARATSRISMRLGVEVPLRFHLTAQTLQDLASLIDAERPRLAPFAPLDLGSILGDQTETDT